MPRIPRRWKEGEQPEAPPAEPLAAEQPTSVLEPAPAAGGGAEVVSGDDATAQGAVPGPETAVDSAAAAAGEAAVQSGDPLVAGAPAETIVAPGGAVSAEAAEAAPVPEHAPPDATPRFRERSRMRRRLRYLRRRRELAFRDLGGLIFDLHRFGRDRSDLVAQKLEGLGAIDGELRTIEGALGERRELTELREAGIAACPRCQTLHDPDANFCPGCGAALRSTAIRDAAPVSVAPADEQPQQPTAAPS